MKPRLVSGQVRLIARSCRNVVSVMQISADSEIRQELTHAASELLTTVELHEGVVVVFGREEVVVVRASVVLGISGMGGVVATEK